jgi:two-component system, chemotaxis family, sensor kinase CheA
MDDLLLDFLTESAESLARLDREIVQLEKTPGDLVLLGSIFRTIHTIKGTCGFLDLQRLEGVAHAAENVLGLLRDGSLVVKPQIVSDVLAAVDVIREILAGLEATQAEPQGDDAALIARLDRWLGPAGRPVNEVIEFPVIPIVAPRPPATPEAAAAPETPSAAPAAKKPRTRASRAAAAPGGADPRPKRTRRRTAEAAAAPIQPAAATPAAAPVVAARETAEPRSAAPGVAESSLRVSVEVLDRLMNLAGEMVLTRNQLLQQAQADEHSPFRLPLQQLNRVTSELQEVVMKVRMQPIGNAWGKLPRLVRDLCQASGKKIELELRGAETELDRQILQAIQDPLTHMIRNSADHGVELPETRHAAGKPESGSIVLEAFHEGGHIIIEIRDDGKGLDAAAIRRKAVERGLVSADLAETLSDTQVYRFIFEAGFSTAEKVTNVSGRGVGMDVVRSNVEQIGGTVELHSTVGVGTTFRIKLPLTLAILSALIVEAGGQGFAIPQIGVVELVRIDAESRARLQTLNGARFYRLRDTLLPLVRLSDVLEQPPADADGFIVICQVGRQRFGLMVDAILDTHEVVVKPIGRMLRHVPHYSGTTLLGDGTVIMILDVPSLGARAGVSGQDDTAAEDGDGAEAAGAQTALVVFDPGNGARQAVPLRRVSRLEQLVVSELENADGRWLVQYRGALLRLLPAWAGLDLRARDPRPTIVFDDGDASIGLCVETIVDIVEDVLDIQIEASTPGVLGTAVIAGRSTEIVDVDWLFGRRAARTGDVALEGSADAAPHGADADELYHLLRRVDRDTLIDALQRVLQQTQPAEAEEVFA